ncbi:MAG: transporter substrate-binding domain-containing protein [Chitinispirillia bacterium]|nr:transporter substrate-binding domain-containing protein [Chitinispirillia bacterium]
MYRFIYAVMLAALLAVNCAKSDSTGAHAKRVFSSLADFGGARIASEEESVFKQYIDRVIPNVEHVHYVSLADIVSDLLEGKVDAISLDMPIALYLAARNNSLAVFPFVVAEDGYGFAVAKGSELGVKGNDVLANLRESGIIGVLEKQWFSSDEGVKSMPRLEHRLDFDGSAGTIRYGWQNTLIPMAYATPEGVPVGFDLDIAHRIAYELNMNVTVTTMPFAELLPSLISGEIDMAGGSLSITGERQQSVDFIGPYFEGGTTLVVKRSRMGAPPVRQ